MNVKNCKRCGAIFQNEGKALCMKCTEDDEADFKRVKDFLWDHPKSSLIEVSNMLEISAEKVKRFLREGRLEVVGDSNMLLACENCGKAISSGRYCDGCQSTVKSGLKTAAREIEAFKEEKEAKKPEGGFFFKGKDKK